MNTYHYNLANAPASFDFVVWLSACAAHNKGEPFNIIISPANNNKTFKDSQRSVYGNEAMWQMLYNVMLPATQLFPVRGINLFPETLPGAIPKTPSISMGYTAHIFQALRMRPYSIQVPDWAKKWAERYPENTVVINYRDCAYHPDRNSNFEAWAKAAEEISRRGYHVVACPDVNGRIPSGVSLHLDSSIALKAALFERAYAVLGVNCGTMALAWHNDKVRYVTYRPVVESVPSCTMQDYYDRGFKDGGSWPWAGANQLYQWGDDTYENIISGFERLNIA